MSSTTPAAPAEGASGLGGSASKLTLVDAVAQSVGFMGPVFGIAFLVPLVMGIISATGNGAGTAAPLSILLAGIGVLAVAWIVAEYAKRIQAAGALYDYVTDGLGSKIGAAAGFLYYLGILSLGGALLVLASGTIHDTLAAEYEFTAISDLVWAIILLALVGAVLYWGVALSTRTQLVLAMLSIVTVLIFSVYVIIKVAGDNNLAKAFSPGEAPGGLSGILFGVVYGVLLFTGFETAANLGEETEHPARDIPRAVLFSVLAVGAFFVIGAYAQVAGFGFSLDTFAQNAGAPLFGLAAPSDAGGYGSVTVGRLLEVVVILDMLAVLIGISTAGSRGIFAMARDGRFPKAMTNISGRGTPLVASLAVLALYVVFVVVTHATTWFALEGFPQYFSIFNMGSSFGALALATIYFLLCLGAIRGLADHPSQAKVWTAVIVGSVAMAAAIFGAVYKVPTPTIYVAYAAAVVFAIGLVMAYAVKGTQPAVTTFDELPPSEQGPVKL